MAEEKRRRSKRARTKALDVGAGDTFDVEVLQRRSDGGIMVKVRTTRVFYFVERFPSLAS